MPVYDFSYCVIAGDTDEYREILELGARALKHSYEPCSINGHNSLARLRDEFRFGAINTASPYSCIMLRHVFMKQIGKPRRTVTLIPLEYKAKNSISQI